MITQIPLSKLKPAAKLNVRKTKASDEAEAELKASIAAHGLRQNLIVVPRGEGYAVVAGGRRLAALRALAKDGVVNADAPIECDILEAEADPSEISLTENMTREALHPADQIEQFGRLHKKGKGLSIEQIAERFGHTPRLVEQRVRVADVHPEIIKAYRDGEVDLEVLTAFTLTQDPDHQLKVYKLLKRTNHYVGAYQVHNHLTEEKVDGSSALVKYVGIKAYEKAGGTVTRDLFATQDDRGVYIDDAQKMRDLALEKMERKATALKKEGWKWVECTLDDSADTTSRYDRLYAGEDGHTKEQMAVSGVVLALDWGGRARVTGGLVRQEDRKEAKKIADEQEAHLGHKSRAESKADPQKTAAQSAGLSQAVVEDLRIVRGNLARWYLAQNPDVAFDLLVYSMACKMFNVYYYDAPLSLSCEQAATAPGGQRDTEEFARGNPGQGLFEPMIESLKEKHDKWLGLHDYGEPAEIDKAERFGLFRELAPDEKMSILALCSAAMLRNQLSIDLNDLPEIEQAIDMLNPDWTIWRPTASVFWSRLAKPTLLDVLDKVMGDKNPDEVVAARKMKKGELADYMERVFANPADPDLKLDEASQRHVKAWVHDSFVPSTLKNGTDNAG